VLELYEKADYIPPCWRKVYQKKYLTKYDCFMYVHCCKQLTLLVGTWVDFPLLIHYYRVNSYLPIVMIFGFDHRREDTTLRAGVDCCLSLSLGASSRSRKSI
jgi:hypothetical protein